VLRYDFMEAEKNDINGIIELIQLNSDTFAKSEIPAARESISYLIEQQDMDNKFYVAKRSGLIIGCGGYSKENDTNGVYTINWLATHPQFKRRGIATHIYTYCESELYITKRARLLILNAGSGEQNRFFYKKMGFKESGRIPQYYNKNKDLIWYYKILGE
jgi:ribosomal protein S18 acetylase RimI-like enzyme